MSPPEPPSGPPKEDFESEEKEFKERKIGSDDNIEVPDKQMSKEDNIKLIREWRRTRSIMKDDQNPSFRIPKSKGRYPYFALFRNPNFDINTFEVETWEELKVTTLTPHLMVLGFGEDGIAWVRDEKSSVVFKMVSIRWISSFISTLFRRLNTLSPSNFNFLIQIYIVSLYHKPRESCS